MSTHIASVAAWISARSRSAAGECPVKMVGLPTSTSDTTSSTGSTSASTTDMRLLLTCVRSGRRRDRRESAFRVGDFDARGSATGVNKTARRYAVSLVFVDEHHREAAPVVLLPE